MVAVFELEGSILRERHALETLKVIDAATLFAGPIAASMLADFGADVLKLEHPDGDAARSHGHSKEGVNLWWKSLNRNKRAVTLYLGAPEGQEVFRRLVRDVDVLIENFRPGTLERWGLGYESLSEMNPRLILARVTGFGQMGPYKARPGFGTLAEAMSGFAHITGQKHGPPTLPPLALADGIAGITTAFAIMVALRDRASTGRGQVVDLAIIEPILAMLGPQLTVYDQLGLVQMRNGNRSNSNAPRNIYRTEDNKWVAVSTSARSIAERVMKLVGSPGFTSRPWFATGEGRVGHVDELDKAVASWIGEHTRDEVTRAFDGADAAVAPVYDVADVMTDPQYQALKTIVTIEDPELGLMKMQNVLFRLSESPGKIRTTGPKLGEHNHEVYTSLGLNSTDIERLRGKGVL